MTDLDNNSFDLSKYKVLDERIIFNEKTGINQTIMIVKEKKERPEYVKRAMQKYIDTHKDDFYKNNRERIKKKCEDDPEYKERLKQQKKESYLRRKEEKNKIKNNIIDSSNNIDKM